MPSQINIKWSATDIAIDVDEGESVGSLKRRIHEQTKVPPSARSCWDSKPKGGSWQGMTSSSRTWRSNRARRS